MTVVVTDAAAVPRAAPTDPLARAGPGPADGSFQWHPDRAATGPVSMIVSAADQRILVLRNGTIIGSAPARIEGPVTGTSAFVRRSGGEGTSSWIEVPMPGAIAARASVSFAGRVHIAAGFRALLDPLLVAGTSVIIGPDSLRAGSPAPVEILGSEEGDTPGR